MSTLIKTGANPTESAQNLTPGRFWHAEAESDVKTLQISHPDLEMKENHLHFFITSVHAVSGELFFFFFFKKNWRPFLFFEILEISRLFHGLREHGSVGTAARLAPRRRCRFSCWCLVNLKVCGVPQKREITTKYYEILGNMRKIRFLNVFGGFPWFDVVFLVFQIFPKTNPKLSENFPKCSQKFPDNSPKI